MKLRRTIEGAVLERDGKHLLLAGHLVPVAHLPDAFVEHGAEAGMQ